MKIKNTKQYEKHVHEIAVAIHGGPKLSIGTVLSHT